MRVSLILITVIFFSLGAGSAWLVHAPHAIYPSFRMDAKVLIGGPFDLVTHKGEAVTEKTFDGRLKLVYFCYTNSSDICPAGLQVISAVLKKLEQHSDRVTALFVTFDPDQDTQEKLATYLHDYHPEIIGLTGSPEQTRRAAEAYRVYYSREKSSASPGGYIIRHSTYIYLMGHQGEYLSHFNHGVRSGSIVKMILKYL